ncbi:MAG TPA: isoleucine--tRNA ligase [Candidatus Brocadiia bacterium]|nr:isoleucine--tRNA ligase [Candidatus Brocadiia bacterium]
MAGDYKKTINLPKTAFPMAANLAAKEPVLQKQWETEGLYRKIRKARAGCPKYILHDGPPYPTGDLHLGTGLNKILKDVIVRYRTMQGFDAPYVPGWDCHGLPIEHKVLQEVGDKAEQMSSVEIRAICRKYATKFLESQKRQFKSLGVIGDWDNPYLTLKPEYEAGVLEVFARMVDAGCIYRSLKPIHWCMSCATTLAEAELEYADVSGPSIFVNFPLVDDVSDIFGLPKDIPAHVMIWTTTPWTLPANLAIALHPDFEYVAVVYANPKNGNKEATILAYRLAAAVMQQSGITEFTEHGRVPGKALEGKRYRQILYEDKVCPVVLAKYVTLTDGTGCVHTAPGHGREDFLTGCHYALEILSPVNEKGFFTKDAGQFAGLHINDGEKPILDKLVALGALMNSGRSSHSYPHCWRCSSPVIFRATEQWFVGLERSELRKRALEEIAKTKWIPVWGEERIRGMVADRPDWCISRQCDWGVPIPAFYCKKCGATLMTGDTIRRVADIVAKEGSDAWFAKPVEYFVPPDAACPSCGTKEFRKENDIFDVWMESGSSHNSVCRKHPDLAYPADLYLEGTDQHRGWFQLSLLPSVAAWGRAPFKCVLTHGFVVDAEGQKMSKSKGNFLSVDDGVHKFRAEILRLWVSSLDFRNDMSVVEDIIKGNMVDMYRDIRNTFRFMLGNLNDFDAAKDRVPYAEMVEMDRWALGELAELIRQTTAAYEEMEFHKATIYLHSFCRVQMSAFYLDVLKDRLYCSAPKWEERRSAQTALYEILDALVRLAAPILVHTCEEVWGYIPQKSEDVESVHLAHMPKAKEEWTDSALAEKWEKILKLREDVARPLEELRAAGRIGKSLEASIAFHTDDSEATALLKELESELPEILMLSEVRISTAQAPQNAAKCDSLSGVAISASVSEFGKCARCWNQRESVGKNAEHPDLCERCVKAVS